MSDTDDRTSNKNDPYAPKWVRESPRLAEGLQRNEQTVANKDARRDQARTLRAVDAASAREAQSAPRAQTPLRKNEGAEPDQVPGFLDAQFLRRQPPPAPQTLKWVAAAGALVLAALLGGGVALFLSGKQSSEPGIARSTDTLTTPIASKHAAETLKAREQLSSSGSGSTFARTEPKPGAQDAVASLRDASARNVRGVTDNEIRLGISAPFSGSAKELGNQMKLGIETALGLINEAGGIHGRQAKLIAADDGYEPSRTAETMSELYDKQQVFGFIGNVGTPTAVVALPYALERKALFFGAFTGAGLLRRDPPDRYVFNYRASYAEETYAVVRYLVKLRGLKPEQIAVFAQQDAYGDSGFAGVAKAVRALRRGDELAILRLDYKRNTVDVDDAVARLRAHKKPIKAVVMVSTYRAAAKFIEKTRDLYPGMIYTNVSFVGSTALADELMLLGPRYAKGVIVTQVVPAVDSYASTVLRYKAALIRYFPGVAPDFVSLEGYVVGNLLLEGMKRAGRQLDTEKLVEALERCTTSTWDWARPSASVQPSIRARTKYGAPSSTRMAVTRLSIWSKPGHDAKVRL